MRRIYMTILLKKRSLLTVATAVSVLSIIPGCSLFDKKSKKSSVQSTAIDMSDDQDSMTDNSAAIATASGKPLITKDRLEREKQVLIESQPQLKQMIAMMPAGALDKNLTEGLINQEVIGFYVKDKGIDQSPTYKAELSRMIKSIPQALNVKFFTENITASISDSAVRSFYDANKDSMPELVLSRGGVLAQGISFATEQEAQAFLEKVNALNGDMQKAAQEMNNADQLQDFKQVNNQSVNVGAQLREKIMGITTFPTVKLLKADDEFWVVKATGKEPLKYREFESLKDNLRQFLGQKKMEEELARLRKEYNIVIDESFFGNTQDNEAPSFDDLSMGEDDDMPMDEGSQEAHNQHKAQARTATAA